MSFRTTCLICESTDLKEIVHLGQQPFADTFVSKKRESDPDRMYPLVCDLCRSCGNVQLRCVTEPERRYSEHEYSYTSSNSKFSRDHWDAYADEVIASTKAKEGGLIVEIGSNDGYLSANFVKKGYNVIGVDPSEHMAKLAKERDVETCVGLFNEAIAKEIIEKYGKADLIIANNVYNHSDNPVAFTKAVALLLADDGCFVSEQPYWQIGLEEGKFDQIYHEHISYFTVKSITKLLERAQLHVSNACVVDYHGGSLRTFAKKQEGTTENNDIATLLEREESYGTFTEEVYKTLMKKVLEHRNAFLQKLYKMKSEGATIIGVGAAAKANTFLNYYNIDATLLDYVTDASPHKQGKFTPGTRIPITGDEVFAKYDKPYALILSWNISGMLKEILLKINPNIQFLSLAD